MKADAESLRAAIKGMSVEDLFETVPNYAPHVCAPHVQCMCMYMHMCMCLSIPCVTLAHTTCITASTCAGGVQAAGRSQRQVQVRPKTPPKPAAPATSPTHTAHTSSPATTPTHTCPRLCSESLSTYLAPALLAGTPTSSGWASSSSCSSSIRSSSPSRGRALGARPSASLARTRHSPQRSGHSKPTLVKEPHWSDPSSC